MMNELNIVALAVQGSSSAWPVRLRLYRSTASTSSISMIHKSIEVIAILTTLDVDQADYVGRTFLLDVAPHHDDRVTDETDVDWGCLR